MLAVKNYLPDGLRREWLEAEDAPMEGLVPEIVSVLLKAGPLLAEERRRREEAERRRYEEQQRRKQDRNRWRHLVRMAEAQREADLARAFIEALKAKNTDPDTQAGERTVREWIAWAEAKVAAADVLGRGAAVIFTDVAGVNSWTYND